MVWLFLMTLEGKTHWQEKVQLVKAADVARLNSAVSEEEKKINNSYYQIGKLYVALHPQDYEADFAALVGSIVSSQSKIQTILLSIG